MICIFIEESSQDLQYCVVSMRSFILATVVLGVFSQENEAAPGLKILNSRVKHRIQRRKADKSPQYGAPAPPPPTYGAPAPAPASYGAPAPASDVVDLHNKEFCVDVSSYQPVVWVEKDSEECHTVFVKKCEDKQENVCADVTETRCEVSHVLKIGTIVSHFVSS